MLASTAGFAPHLGHGALSLSAHQIKQLRESQHISQPVFAALLYTSTSTAQKLGIGNKAPGSPSLKLLNRIERTGIETVLRALRWA